MSLGLVLDLPGALVKLYQVIRQDRELADWVRLVLSTVYSGLIGTLGVTGILLTQHTGASVAIGTGLISGAVCVLTVLLRMPQGRGLLIAMPTDVEHQYETTNVSVSVPKK